MVKVFIIVLCLLNVSGCIKNTSTFDEVKWRNHTSHTDPAMLYAPHFKDGRFFNPWMPMDQNGFGRLLRWKLSPKEEYTDEENSLRPILLPDLKKRIEQMPGQDFIVWIGHSTFLIRVNGEYWLTDPVFSDRALLPKRKTPPALSLEEMKGLKGKLNIIISHNHYDHLDKASMQALPEDARVFVPLGLKGFVAGMNKKFVKEMDWWDSFELGNGTRIVCLPAQHWSRRISQDVSTTLWASFLLITPTATIYYGGDSGYFVGYKEIGRVYPGIDYALLPVGAYRPRWFMHYAHMDIREALRALDDLGAQYLVPTQWGTFQLGDEPVGYPLLDLKKTMEESGFNPAKAIIMDLGQIVPFSAKDVRKTADEGR
jgi:L-ascorbate metabolism protein UlaG (beta-lactamase superfamily)